MKPKIILLSGEKQFAKYIYNGLSKTYEIESVIFEKMDSVDMIYKRRMKRIGYLKVIGQKLFDKYIIKFLLRSSKGRIREIIKKYELDNSKIPEQKVILVGSINDADTINLIRSINPQIVVVNATRILKKDLINSIEGRFINIHSGILPNYRGYSGGYWALVNKDKARCGSTIHFVNEKIDAGSILAQQVIDISPADNYLTYAFLHAAVEIQLLKEAIFKIINGEYELTAVNTGGKLRYGPTIWGYLFNRFARGVR